MIIYRYLARQLFWSTVAVSAILTFILVASRFLKYLSEAAVGKLDGAVVFLIMAYRLPDFLQLILPLGLFLGVLLAYGRMYLENEMVVLQACGVSQKQLVGWTLIPAACMALCIGSFSFFLAPWGAQQAERLLQEQERRSGLEVLSPRRFHASSDGSTVTYVEDISSRENIMQNLFIVDYDRKSRNDDYRKVVIMRAETGRYEIDQETGYRYLVMSAGQRFEVDPGSPVYSHYTYGDYRVRLEDKRVDAEITEYQQRYSQDLLADGSLAARLELQWRLSLMLMVPIVVLIAVPLAKVNPRQGRYLKMLPAMLIYLAYLAVMMGAKGQIEKGNLPREIGILWVHLIFLGIGIGLNYWPLWRLRRQAARDRRATGATA